jgi:hypothetical protein
MVSALMFKRTPNRWNGDLSINGGRCACPHRMAARRIASALWSVEI